MQLTVDFDMNSLLSEFVVDVNVEMRQKFSCLSFVTGVFFKTKMQNHKAESQ